MMRGVEIGPFSGFTRFVNEFALWTSAIICLSSDDRYESLLCCHSLRPRRAYSRQGPPVSSQPRCPKMPQCLMHGERGRSMSAPCIDDRTMRYLKIKPLPFHLVDASLSS